MPGLVPVAGKVISNQWASNQWPLFHASELITVLLITDYFSVAASLNQARPHRLATQIGQ